MVTIIGLLILVALRKEVIGLGLETVDTGVVIIKKIVSVGVDLKDTAVDTVKGLVK